jgi:C1A family cysteine protease
MILVTPQPRKVARYGWTPDLPDFNDYRYAKVVKPLANRPRHTDLRAKMPPVVDQGDLGSCTANALAGAFGFLHPKLAAVSRLFLYYNERVIEHTVSQDAGAMIRDGVKVLNKIGVCLESTWPYNVAKFATKPPLTANTEAATHKVSSYIRLTTHTDKLDCLAQGFPFVFGFTVYPDFQSDYVAKTGLLPMPTLGQPKLGGHAVCAVGYDEDKKQWLVRNSWGVDWGVAGYFTMPFDYLDNTDLSDDFWTLRA